MGKRSLAAFTSQSLKPFAFLALDSLSVEHHRPLMVACPIRPSPIRLSLRFGDVGSQVHRFTQLESVGRVIPFISGHFLNRLLSPPEACGNAHQEESKTVDFEFVGGGIP